MKLGISPICWSNDDLPDLGADITFEQCIEEMALTGYEGCEVGHKFPEDPKEVLEMLAPYDLQICNQWFDFKLSTESLQSNLERLKPHLEYLQALDCSIVGGGETGKSYFKNMTAPILEYKSPFVDLDDYKRYGEALTKCGELAATYGIHLAFHSHLGTPIQSMEATQLLLENSDPDFVGLNYDSAHFYAGGEDPYTILKELYGRIIHIHLKNVRESSLEIVSKQRLSFLSGVRQGIFTVPGDPDGVIDFQPIMNFLEVQAYKGWVVVEADQDPKKAPPKDYVSMAYCYLTSLLR